MVLFFCLFEVNSSFFVKILLYFAFSNLNFISLWLVNYSISPIFIASDNFLLKTIIPRRISFSKVQYSTKKQHCRRLSHQFYQPFISNLPIRRTLVCDLYPSQTSPYKSLIYKFNQTYFRQLFLSASMRKPLNWSSQEDQLILSNISLIKSKKWKTLAQILKQNGFNKKQAECRERYINFLTLSVDKTSKISHEDLQLFYQKYEEFGPRWTQIQKFLPKMSQAELKNIFYGNIRCIVKKVFKFFTSKTAVFVNKFDTFTLQNIYSGKKNYKGLNFLKEDIKSMRYQFDEQLCFSLIDEKKDKYKGLFNVLLEEELTKTSKHYQFFKKIQENEIGSEEDIFEGLSDSGSELRFLDEQGNKAALGCEKDPQQSRHRQSLIKDENLSPFMRWNESENENFYKIWNYLNEREYYVGHRQCEYSQAGGRGYYFSPGQDLCFEQYGKLQHGMFNSCVPCYQYNFYFTHPRS